MGILELKNISYRYDGAKHAVFKDINAAFGAGRIYAIIGKSGAGKTTLLSLIAGLDVCMSGELLYRGRDLKAIDRDNYRAESIGVIFQSYNLLTNATAAENIVLSMNISSSPVKDKKKYAYELLEKVGIDRETADRKILKLSGGEQQRIGIARAIAHEPDLIIADEPTGNLDDKTEDGVMKILADLARNDGKCVIIVTHSQKISSYADEIYKLADGKLTIHRG
jgi:putative ABC transport system ATP-binding protein